MRQPIHFRRALLAMLLIVLTLTLFQLAGCAITGGGSTTQPTITPGTITYAVLNVENLGYVAAVGKATVQVGSGKMTAQQIADFEIWREQDEIKIDAQIHQSLQSGLISQQQYDQLYADQETFDIAWSTASVLRSRKASIDLRPSQRSLFVSIKPVLPMQSQLDIQRSGGVVRHASHGAESPA